MDAAPPVEAGKPHICVVTETYPPEVNGVALTLARLLNGLQARGHAVSLVRPRHKRAERTDNAADFPVTLVPSLPLPDYDGLHLGLPANRLLRQNWARQRPDAAYVATEGPLGLSAVRAARRLGVPVFSGFHTNFRSYSRHYRLGWLQPVVLRYLRWFHNRTRGTLTPSIDLRDRLQDLSFRNVSVLGRGLPWLLIRGGSRLFNAIYTLRAAALMPALSRHLSLWVKRREYDEDAFFRADGAAAHWASAARRPSTAWPRTFRPKCAKSVDWGNDIRDSFSDLRFTDANRVPFPFMRVIREKFNLCSVVTASKGPKLRDHLDGHWSLDVGGSYGVNVAGFERYEEWMRKGLERVKDVGPVLGPLHPLVADNIALLKSISGLDEVSFHMSGTKAVMAAVRLARFNTRRKLIVAFSDAYHGWWDGVQTGLRSERAISDCLTLKDMHPVSLDAIRKRSKEIAGVLINPVQSFHPNAPPPSDAVLLTSNVRQTQDLASDYARWLRQLSEVCRGCNVPLIFDEVYSGFRLAPGAAHRPGSAAVVRAHGAGGRVARRVSDVEAQHVAGDDLVRQAGHRSLHRHRGLPAPLHQRRQRAAAGASEQKPMSAALFLAAALLLGLERLFYVWVWRHPETFCDLCRRPALWFLGTPVDGVQRFFYVFKVIQIGVFLVWCGYFGDGASGPAWPGGPRAHPDGTGAQLQRVLPSGQDGRVLRRPLRP